MLIQIEYTNDYQEFVAPMNGWYQIELWGAQGGGNSSGGKGGYTSGKIEMTAGDRYYIYVGNKPTLSVNAYNGGGNTNNSHYPTDDGGGATDIRYFGSTTPTASNLIWDDELGLKSRIMVAGGGGGHESYSGGVDGGHAGGLIGLKGSYTGSIGSYKVPTGGLQDSGGAKDTTQNAASPAENGSFGKGGNGNLSYGGGGGGSGYYGGGGGANCSHVSSGGGGSSFISGYAGVNAINSDGTHSNNTRHYSEKYFLASEMKIGNNAGNGKAKIAYLGAEPTKISNILDNVQYIKDCATGNNSNGHVYWNEIQAIDENGLNVAYGKDIIDYTVSEHSGYPYSKITNGIIGNSLVGGATSNSSQGTNRCVIVDLEAKYNLNEVAVWHIFPEGDSSYHTHNSNYLQVSSDKTNWITIISTESVAENSTGKRVSFYK